MWEQDDSDGGPGAFDSIALDEAVNAIFLVSLILSANRGALPEPERQRIERAIDELDGLIRDIRLVAFGHARPSPQDQSHPIGWLLRLRETTTGIDQLMDAETSPFAAIDLQQARQAAHTAIINLTHTD